MRGVALILALITTGLMTGIFQLYAHTVMPGLGKTDDRTFVGGFQALDRAIMNPVFMATFLGPFLLTGVAVFLSLSQGALLAWLVAALLLYTAAMAITVRVNVPLNDALKAAGDPDTIADLAAVRRAFDEGRWVRFNLVRTLLSTAAFACLAWATVLFGRISG